jgi:hypothetical protein
MIEKRQISDYAQGWVQEMTEGVAQESTENPLFYKDKELYLKFDSIRLGNSECGTGLVVRYRYRGYVVCIFPVEKTTLHYDPDSRYPSGKHLDLDGITGSMKMVLY